MTARIANLKDLATNKQLEILVNFAYQLTVAGREAYSDGTFAVRKPEMLRDLNEIMHQILQHTGHLMLADRHRYPDELLDTFISGLANRSGLEKVIDWAWKAASQKELFPEA